MNEYDVIIIGGSYAGLSAGMALGRSLRKVLIIDSGEPCNRQTPRSHNFLTHDGKTPQEIAEAAREQVLQYPTITFVKAKAIKAKKVHQHFEIEATSGKYTAKKILFATGVKDLMPDIEGFKECWGISVLHCPYCHGYEVKDVATGIIANGDMGFEMTRLIHHWTKDLILFTNGTSKLTAEHFNKITAHGIRVIEQEIKKISHNNGYVQHIHLADGNQISLRAIYARPALVQHCSIPQELGCEISEQQLLKIDTMQRTTIPGVYAAGDNSIMMRSLSLSIAAGGMAGAVINKDLIEEAF